MVEIQVCLPGWVLVAIVSIAAAPRVAKEVAGLVALLKRRGDS